MSPPIRQRPKTPFERITECVLAYADAEDDDDFAHARDNLRKAAAAYGSSATSELVRDALAKLKAAGVKLGRPRKVTLELVAEVIVREGRVCRAAAVLGVSRWTIRRAIAALGTPEKR